jgi:hypothetical protein
MLERFDSKRDVGTRAGSTGRNDQASLERDKIRQKCTIKSDQAMQGSVTFQCRSGLAAAAAKVAVIVVV